MLGFPLYFFLLLPQFFVMSNIYSATAGVSPPYIPTDNILLNCGTPSNTTSMDGRQWDIDSLPKFTPSQNILNTSMSASTEQIPHLQQIPYSTARIFTSKFTYTFHLSSPGQKFLRLYFHPANYSNGYDTTKSFFKVDAANHTLLSNLSAFLNHQPPSFTLVKEYVIAVNQSRVLEVTFTPSPSSYAFVNGIEVVSIPDKLYIKGNDNGEDAIKMVGQKTGFNIEDSMALENFYRLNVGGPYISSTDDTGMFRAWDTDEQYLLTPNPGYTPKSSFLVKYTPTTPSYTAPAIVYSTARTMLLKSYGANMTWTFQVDPGFYYLLRLFFCEFIIQVTQSNERVFSIYISNQTAEEFADVIAMSGGSEIPVYEDYVVFVRDNPDGSKSKPDLWLSLNPNIKSDPAAENTILNGLEIFKVSQSGGSLASPNPESALSPPLEKGKVHIKNGGGSHSPLVGACTGGSIGGIILFSTIVGFLLYRRRRVKSQDIINKSGSTTTPKSSLPSCRSQKYYLEEIILATGNFDDKFVIGRGGFGNVYKGYLEDNTPCSNQFGEN